MADVIATQERMVFSVASHTIPQDQTKKPKRYRVDMLANGGTIQCSCSNWGFQVWPNIKAGLPILVRDERDTETATLCKHGADALLSFNQTLLPDMARTYENEPRPF